MKRQLKLTYFSFYLYSKDLWCLYWTFHNSDMHPPTIVRVRSPQRSQRSLSVVKPTRAITNSPTHFTLEQRKRSITNNTVRCKEKFAKSSGSFGNTSHSTYVAAVG